MIRSQQNTLNIDELITRIEPVIRRVIREEFKKLIKEEKEFFYLNPESPLYKDMEEIKQRKKQNQTKLYSHEEVWGE